jgi:hypothetical protein
MLRCYNSWGQKIITHFSFSFFFLGKEKNCKDSFIDQDLSKLKKKNTHTVFLQIIFYIKDGFFEILTRFNKKSYIAKN